MRFKNLTSFKSSESINLKELFLQMDDIALKEIVKDLASDNYYINIYYSPDFPCLRSSDFQSIDSHLYVTLTCRDKEENSSQDTNKLLGEAELFKITEIDFFKMRDVELDLEMLSNDFSTILGNYTRDEDSFIFNEEQEIYVIGYIKAEDRVKKLMAYIISHYICNNSDKNVYIGVKRSDPLYIDDSLLELVMQCNKDACYVDYEKGYICFSAPITTSTHKDKFFPTSHDLARAIDISYLEGVIALRDSRN